MIDAGHNIRAVTLLTADEYLAMQSMADTDGLSDSTDRKFNRMRPSMARVLGLEIRSAKEG